MGRRSAQSMVLARDAVRYAAAAVLVAVALAFAVRTTVIAFEQILGRQARQQALVDALIAQRSAFVALVDEETGVRGYVATGDPVFLEPYRSGSRVYAAYRAAPPPLDDPASQAALAQFEDRADALQVRFRSLVAAVARGDRRGALAALPAGKRAFDELRGDDRRASMAMMATLAAGTAATAGAIADARIAMIIIVIMLIAAGAFSTIMDVRGRRSAQLARHDSVTELPNRRAFEERLGAALADRRPDAYLGVLFIDIDGFKPVNDRLGHAAGDELLAAFGDRLRRAVRPADFVARVGGDEFTAILQLGSPDGAAVVSERILRDVEAPYVIAGTVARVGASIGLAVAPRDGIHAGIIVQTADEAMYREKRRRSESRT
jgi:diguanylate cyclase (GGDEF)-like protein